MKQWLGLVFRSSRYYSISPGSGVSAAEFGGARRCFTRLRHPPTTLRLHVHVRRLSLNSRFYFLFPTNPWPSQKWGPQFPSNGGRLPVLLPSLFVLLITIRAGHILEHSPTLSVDICPCRHLSRSEPRLSLWQSRSHPTKSTTPLHTRHLCSHPPLVLSSHIPSLKHNHRHRDRSPNTVHQPYNAVAALTRHPNQRNKEIARQKHSPDQYRALCEKLNVERSLLEKDAPTTKNNIHNITKKWSWYSKPLAQHALCSRGMQTPPKRISTASRGNGDGIFSE